MIINLQPVHKIKFSKFADDLTIVIPGSLVLDWVVERVIFLIGRNRVNSLLICLNRNTLFCAKLGVYRCLVSPPEVI
jgi:hypothetical protein